MTESAATKDKWASYHTPAWSRDEKEVTREAFERALHEELDEITREVRKRAAKIKQGWELWDLEAYLGEQRREIDRKYDYRYSVLPMVLGNLLREKRVSERDLHGLSAEKMQMIRSYAKI
jgi:ribosomal protein S4